MCAYPPSVSPLCQNDTGGWGFWDETWAYWYGPYPTETMAQSMFDLYGKALNGKAADQELFERLNTLVSGVMQHVEALDRLVALGKQLGDYE